MATSFISFADRLFGYFSFYRRITHKGTWWHVVDHTFLAADYWTRTHPGAETSTRYILRFEPCKPSSRTSTSASGASD